MTDRDPLYRRHRFPAEIIAHAVWLYFRFPLNLRMIEDLLAARGVVVSHGTSMRPSFRSGARGTGCGALSIRTVSSWRFGTKSPQRQGGKAPDAQAVAEPGQSAAGDDHRQTSFLRRRKAGSHARRRASFAQRLEQSGGEFSSADPATRADHEALQVTATSTTLRVHS